MRNEDFAHEYEPCCPRTPTLTLINLLRREHPERETFDGWALRIEQPDDPDDDPFPGQEEEEERPVAPMELLSETPRAARMRMVYEVARSHRVPVDAIFTKSRSRRVVHARQAIMRKLSAQHYSLCAIARFLNVDHSTVHWGIRQHEARYGSS